MKTIFKTTYSLFLFLCVGCAGLTPPLESKLDSSLYSPVPHIEPQAIITSLNNINSALETNKGLGKIRIWTPSGSQSTRLVWAGYRAEKLRVEILGVAGRPFSSLVYDGRQLLLSLHTEGRFYKSRKKHADLGRLINIPISIQDMLFILAGRVPILPDAKAVLVAHKYSDEYMLILERGWFKKSNAKIYLRNNLKTVWKYELYQNNGKLRYRVEYDNWKKYGDYLLPTKLQFSDDAENRVNLSINKIWPDSELSSTTFNLKPPD